MNVNLNRLLTDLLEGLVFYAYEHLRAIYILIRYPFRGPRYLAYRAAHHPTQAVSPHGFLLINLIAVFLFIDIVSPLILAGLRAIGLSLVSTLELAVDSEVNWLPLILRSLALLVSTDILVRLLSLPVRAGRRRAQVTNSILFSLALQPLAIVVAVVYLMQFDLFSTTHNTFISVSTVALLFGLALPTMFFVRRELARSLRGSLLQFGPVISGAASVLTGLFITGLYAEAVALKWWEVGAPPETMSVVRSTCRADSDGSVEVDAVIENRTKKRFILPAGDAILAYFGDEQVEQTSLETSLGHDVPFLIINDGAVVWVRLRGKAQPSASQATASAPQCIVQVMRGSFIVGEAHPTAWWVPLE
jgi:hypothetical protein